ncbi:peroxiredoxin Q/BCP [Candidatus Thermokryptus mobilis]|uniref:thioredoxin-dependent peroxiredoxin n=1 Tax=Candidatus Thermokryptus mobilis TaxID=1643428 RepID=A0A0S4N3Q4_9BACT|nr:thioredoxin-dependent thiol peroxidase [Candidatus Thermokryptus mobilis]CUU04854.1 peroxiredoxin Q/BCP [Candidatus Thermokryptus mobilis]
MKIAILIFVPSFIFLLFSVKGGKLKVGDIAPDFTLEDAFGNKYTLSNYRGKSPVVIYFYPKANTPGCSKQACGIRDEWSKFEQLGVPVFGVSVDSKKSLKKFIDKYSLNFPLLSDESKKVCKDYGVLNLLGFANRVTFIVDKEGKIAHIIDKVDVETHAKEVLDLVKTLLN